MSLRMNLSQKLLTLLGFPYIWHRIVVFEKSAYLVKNFNSTNLEGLLYGIGAVCVRIVVFEKSAYLVKKFKKCH